MRIIMAVLALALLSWAEPAKAQKTYSVSVSNHINLPELTADQVKKILADASLLLQKDPDHPETEDDVRCDVTFTLKGEIGTFGETPPLPPQVAKDQIDAVHGVRSDVDADFYVKVVSRIMDFCRFGVEGLGLGRVFNGCGFPPNFRSIIVVHPDRHIDRNRMPIPQGEFPDDRLWAHEFGHLTGLGHRVDERALMTPCPLDEQFSKFPHYSQVRVSRQECTCLKWGPGFGPNGTCPLPSVSCEQPQSK